MSSICLFQTWQNTNTYYLTITVIQCRRSNNTPSATSSPFTPRIP
jgi:hypothetical protein